MGRRTRLGGLATIAVAIATLLSACASGDAKPAAFSKSHPVAVRIGIVNPINSPDFLVVVADKKGFFAKYGIKPKLIQAQSTVTPLLSGDFDMSNLGVQGMIPLAQGQPLVFLAAVFPRPTVTLLVRPGSPLVKVAHKWPDVMQALRGKKLGVTVAGAVIDNMARYMATLAGLKPDKDITIQAAGDAATLAANLESGTYDAALEVSPIWEKEIARGKAVSVLDMYKGEGPPQLKMLPFTTPASTQKFLKAHPGVGEAYYKSMVDAMKWAKDPANRSELTAIVQKASGADAVTLKAQLNTFVGALDTPTYSKPLWDSGVAMLKANGINVSKLDYSKDVQSAAQG